MALPKPIITEADVHAVRAVLAGRADSDQQRRAMRWIGEELCHIFDSPYVADGNDRDTFIMLGRHQVGVMISAMQTPATLEAAREFDRKSSTSPPTKRGTRKNE